MQLNEASVTSTVILIRLCSQLREKGGSPEGNSEFDGLKCSWICLRLPRTPELPLWEKPGRPSRERVLRYLPYRQSIRLIPLDCPVHLPTNVPWKTLKVKGNSSSFWMVYTVMMVLVSCLQVHIPIGICRDLPGTGFSNMQMEGFLLLFTYSRGFLQRRIFVLLFSCLKQYADLHFICKT